jgi:hypothetical protein
MEPVERPKQSQGNQLLSAYEHMKLAPVAQRFVELAHQVQQGTQDLWTRATADGRSQAPRQQTSERGHEMEM